MGKKVTNKSIPEQVLDFMQNPYQYKKMVLKILELNFIDAYDPYLLKQPKSGISK